MSILLEIGGNGDKLKPLVLFKDIKKGKIYKILYKEKNVIEG